MFQRVFLNVISDTVKQVKPEALTNYKFIHCKKNNYVGISSTNIPFLFIQLNWLVSGPHFQGNGSKQFCHGVLTPGGWV